MTTHPDRLFDLFGGPEVGLRKGRDLQGIFDRLGFLHGFRALSSLDAGKNAVRDRGAF